MMSIQQILQREAKERVQKQLEKIKFESLEQANEKAEKIANAQLGLKGKRGVKSATFSA